MLHLGGYTPMSRRMLFSPEIASWARAPTRLFHSRISLARFDSQNPKDEQTSLSQNPQDEQTSLSANQTFPDPRRSPGRQFCVFVLILMGQQRLTSLMQVVTLNPQWRVRSKEQTANLRRGLPARSDAGLESEVLNRFCALYMERRSFSLPAILPPYCLI
jgi:hypothetical protein